MFTPFIIEQLLNPVNDACPCGEDIAFSCELDAIAKARQADDPSLEQGAWVTSLKEADWKFVAARCALLLESRSKDLQLAVWLAEASAKTAALRGLGDSLLLIAALCEHYWEQLFPLPDESGFEQRIGNLCWIAARAPQLIRDMAITEGAGTSFSLNDFDGARSRPAGQGDAAGAADLDSARRRTSPEFYEALLRDSAHCMDALGVLERMIDQRLGADGPGFSAARAALQGVIDFVTPAACGAQAARKGEAATTPASVPLATAVPEAAGAAAAGVDGPIQTRAQALAQLRLVAQFFRRTEPHSPVSYLADKAAEWGEQSLHVWLRGVVKDSASFAHLEELLGIDSPQP
jgi:type VI secretion system protein ImpA